MGNSSLNMNTLLIVGGSAVALYFLKDIFGSAKNEDTQTGLTSRAETRTDRVGIRQEELTV
jgi:hypothetical protein